MRRYQLLSLAAAIAVMWVEAVRATCYPPPTVVTDEWLATLHISFLECCCYNNAIGSPMRDLNTVHYPGTTCVCEGFDSEDCDKWKVYETRSVEGTATDDWRNIKSGDTWVGTYVATNYSYNVCKCDDGEDEGECSLSPAQQDFDAYAWAKEYVCEACI